jgi:transposase InsO family protein
VTTHPTAEWIAQQITEAFPWHEAPRYLIRDRDGIYGVAVTRRLRAMGIRDKPIAPGSPWQNCFSERLIGSIRREYLDHIVALGEAHLRRLLGAYTRYYNTSRTHHSLDRMHLSRAQFSGSDALCRMRWSVDFITNTSESEFLVHTAMLKIASRLTRRWQEGA